jgi:hypothetical protein
MSEFTRDAVSLRPMSDDPPPFLSRWSNVYRAVLIYLVLVISTLYAITRVFAA